jgi:hypothetical protein
MPEHPLAMLELAAGQTPRGIARSNITPVESGGMRFQPIILL